MEAVAIKHLSSAPEHFETVATWIYEQWWKNPGSTIDVVKKPLREHLQSVSYPATLVALINDAPAGSVLLIEDDGMATHPELRPWLAALYVSPAHRGQGVGKRLVQALEQHAQCIGFQELYLVTKDKVSFYHGLGWQVHTKVCGQTGITIMHKHLSSPPALPAAQHAHEGAQG